MTADDLLVMRQRAESWLRGVDGGIIVTRDSALNEEHMALDVVVLLAEVERLRAVADVNVADIADWISDADITELDPRSHLANGVREGRWRTP